MLYSNRHCLIILFEQLQLLGWDTAVYESNLYYLEEYLDNFVFNK